MEGRRGKKLGDHGAMIPNHLREMIVVPPAGTVSTVVRRRQSFQSRNNLSAIEKVSLIPAFSFQGSDSLPGTILAKQRPKFPAALREPLAKPLLEPDR